MPVAPSEWAFLQLPAWLLVIAIAFVAGVKGAIWLKQSSKNGNGHSAPQQAALDVRAIESRVETQRAVEGMHGILERISAQLTTSATVLNGSATILAQLQERISHLASTQHVSRELSMTREAIGKEVTSGLLGVSAALSDGIASKLGQISGELHGVKITQELQTGLLELAVDIPPPDGGHKRRRDDR